MTRTAPSVIQIANAFARYANFTLGGGSATVAVLHRELLEKRRWIDQENFTLCFALARLTPGTNLLAFCTGIGWLLRGTLGAAAALLAASIPCTVIVALATALFSRWQENHWAQAAIHGAIAAAVAITVKTCWTIAHPHFKVGSRLRVMLAPYLSPSRRPRARSSYPAQASIHALVPRHVSKARLKASRSLMRAM
jgi:chromate transporter